MASEHVDGLSYYMNASSRLHAETVEQRATIASLQTALAAATTEIEAARKERNPGADYPYWFDEAKKLASQLAAANARADEAWLKANLANEEAAAYRICVEEAGTNGYHLRDWIRTTKQQLQQANARAEAAEAERNYGLGIIASLTAQVGRLWKLSHERDMLTLKLYDADNRAEHTLADRDEAVGLLLRAKGWADVSNMGHKPAWVYEAGAFLNRIKGK